MIFSILFCPFFSFADPLRPFFSEDRVPEPSVKTETDKTETDTKSSTKVGQWNLRLSGYARMPLMISTSDEGTRRPYLIDDQYFLSGFAYTRVSEREWVELFLSAEQGDTRVVTGLFASELSDWSQAALPKGQRGIATAFVEQRWGKNGPLVAEARVGVFWERLGYLDAYDTYLFGRTHIGGGRLNLTLWDHGYLKVGYGAHQGDPTLQRGFTQMNWVVAGVKTSRFDFAGYWVRSSSTDGEYGDGPLQDTLGKEELFIDALGADLYVQIPYAGLLSIGGVYVDAANTLFMGGAHELLHSAGGGVDGLKSRYFGETGTGELSAFTFDWRIRLTDALRSPKLKSLLGQSEVRLFGLYAYSASFGQAEDPTQNFHDRGYLKWGSEASYRPVGTLEGFSLGYRYDRVILDTRFESLSFSVWAPRVGFTPLPGIDLFTSLAFYNYGENVLLSHPQLRNESVPVGYRNFEGPPDELVWKLQAQARW